MQSRHIVPRIEVIEAKLGIEIVTAVEDGVNFCNGLIPICNIVLCYVAPCVVEVEHDRLPVGIGDCPHVVLRVLDVIILRAVVGEAEDITTLVVHKDKHVIACFLTGKNIAVVEILGGCRFARIKVGDGLFGALSVDVVLVAEIRRAIRTDALQLPALPHEFHAVDIDNIADLVALDGGRAFYHGRIVRLRACHLRTECRSTGNPRAAEQVVFRQLDLVKILTQQAFGKRRSGIGNGGCVRRIGGGGVCRILVIAQIAASCEHITPNGIVVVVLRGIHRRCRQVACGVGVGVLKGDVAVFVFVGDGAVEIRVIDPHKLVERIVLVRGDVRTELNALDVPDRIVGVVVRHAHGRDRLHHGGGTAFADVHIAVLRGKLRGAVGIARGMQGAGRKPPKRVVGIAELFFAVPLDRIDPVGHLPFCDVAVGVIHGLRA